MEAKPSVRKYEQSARAVEARISTETYRSQQVNPYIKHYAGRLSVWTGEKEEEIGVLGSPERPTLVDPDHPELGWKLSS